MKNFRWRILTTLAAIVLGLWALAPTWSWYRTTEEQRAAMDPNELLAAKEKALRLGLDLQGGMHLVLEIDDSDLPEDMDKSDLMDRALLVIRNRIDEFGVTEPVVQRAGAKRIIVQLAGIEDPERARKIISRAAVLEFQMVRPGSETRRLVEILDLELADLVGMEAPSPEEEAAADSAAQGDDAQTASLEPVLADTAGSEEPRVELDLTKFLSEDVSETGGKPLESRLRYSQRSGEVAINEVAYVLESDYALLDAYFAKLDSMGVMPDDVEFAWEADAATDGSGNQVRNVYLLTKEPELTGEVLEDARPLPDSRSAIQGNYLVDFDLSRRGRRLFSRATGENVGRLMAIVLDGKVESAPEIQGKIRGGTAQITGRFTPEQAKDLAIVLRAGALPVPIRIEENRSVGPSLGQDSIQMGRTAILYGFAVVLVFMLIYYRTSGLVAVFAMLLNLVLVLAIMVRVFGAVLTLPGIAGFVLTIGMAVDANVLIFERIREELRNQQTFRNAVNRGYERAFRTILDANVTTLITAIALLWFGTGPIQGFAVVLSIGIVVSMFTALFVTRLIFDLLTRPGGMQRVPI